MAAGEKMDDETIALVEAYLDGKLEAFGQAVARDSRLPAGKRSAARWTM